MVKNLVLIVKTNHDFIRTGTKEAVIRNAARLNNLFDAVSDSYIPLLCMLERLEKDGLNGKIGLVLPPVLCTMLEDPKVQDLYLDFLDKRLALGKKELNRNKDDSKALTIIQNTIDRYKELKDLFAHKFSSNLIAKFAEYQQKGLVEILGTCATELFAPHYADLQEAISAQVEIGLQAYKKSFGEIPDGFYLPEFGYTPGIEKIIKAYGYTYTILSSRSVLLTDEIPQNGIFYPLRTDNSLVIFTADPAVKEFTEGENACWNETVYRNENRDIGFELDLKKLTPVLEEKSARYSTGYKYWRKDFSEKNDASYNKNAAFKQAEKDAERFVNERAACLNSAAEYAVDVDFVTSVCVLDENLMRRHWSEYLVWLEHVIRKAEGAGLTSAFCRKMILKPFSLEKISPYYSAGTGDGYGENLLSSRNCWMMRYVRKATERMVDLAERFPSDTGLKTRLLNIGAVELLVAQSSSLAKMIDQEDDSAYAEERFRLSINAFTTVFDSLGSNTVSTEWLTTLENLDNLFPWINYKVFCKKR